MRLWAAGGILALVIIILFALSVPHAREVTAPARETAVPASPPPVTLTDSYKKGTHTLSGTVLAPDACSSVTVDAALAGDASTTESIALALTLPADSGLCLQVPTSVSFRTTLAAPAGLPIAVTVNGVPATTTTP